MKYVCVELLRLYKNTLSKIKGKKCIYTPSCSVYGIESFLAHGFFKGGWLTLKRVLRCAPWGKGGFDPVPYNFKGDIRWCI